MRRNIILFFTTILISHFAYANPCPDSEHLAYDIKDRQNQIDQTLCKNGYVVGYSYYYKAPMYVAYRLNKNDV
jgi:DNA/RNA endonuclease G (NUC1)